MDVCMAAFSYSAVDRKEEGDNQSSSEIYPLPDPLHVERMDGDAGAPAAIAAKLAAGDVGALEVLVEFGGVNRDLFVSKGPGAPEEVFEDEVNGGFRRESSGGSTDSEVLFPPRDVRSSFPSSPPCPPLPARRRRSRHAPSLLALLTSHLWRNKVRDCVFLAKFYRSAAAGNQSNSHTVSLSVVVDCSPPPPSTPPSSNRSM